MNVDFKKAAEDAAGFSMEEKVSDCRPKGLRLAHAQLKISKELTLEDPPALIWHGAHLVRITPGIYTGFAANKQLDYVRRYRRWSLRIGFKLLAEDVEVSAYYNMGNGRQPVITRGGHYFQAWCIVNGGLPVAGQNMGPDAFLEPGLFFTLDVGDSTDDVSGNRKPDEAVTSKVKKVLGVCYS